MKSVSTSQAPKAIGPYSQAILTSQGQMLFTSGQIALHPETGQLVGEDVRSQAVQVMKNLGAVLAAGGASFENVVKTTIFLASMGDFATVNEVYAGYFKAAPPARSTVAAAALPKGALVEIEAIAVVPEGT